MCLRKGPGKPVFECEFSWLNHVNQKGFEKDLRNLNVLPHRVWIGSVA